MEESSKKFIMYLNGNEINLIQHSKYFNDLPGTWVTMKLSREKNIS